MATQKHIPTALPSESDAQYVSRCAKLGITMDDLDDFFEKELPVSDGDSDITVATHFDQGDQAKDSDGTKPPKPPKNRKKAPSVQSSAQMRAKSQ